MNVTVETTPESNAQFHVTLPWEAIDKASAQVVRRVSQNQKIPGFRPGHAPRALIERMVGRDAIYEEAIDTLVQDAVSGAARSHELTLLQPPHAHVHEINYGAEHDVTVTVPVLGKGELTDYQDLHLTLEPEPVTDEDIDTIINRARDQMAVYVPVDRPAQMGDRVTVDLVLTAGEKELSNLKDNEFDLVEDRTGLFTGMDQHIVGMTEGESKTFTTTIPEDYGKTELAGQPANYAVTLTKVTIKELPEIDADFAMQAGKFDSVDAMRDGVRTDLTQSRLTTAQRQLRDKVIDALIERLTLAIPPLLQEAEVDDLLQELSNMLARERIDLTQYLRLMGKDRDQYREEMKPEAARRIKQRRALELVAERENITVTDRDVQRVLDAYNDEAGAVKRARLNQLKPSQRTAIERSLVRDLAIDWLMVHLTDATASGTIGETPAAATIPAAEGVIAEADVATPGEMLTGSDTAASPSSPTPKKRKAATEEQLASEATSATKD